jgi:hypothetical protein
MYCTIGVWWALALVVLPRLLRLLRLLLRLRAEPWWWWWWWWRRRDER